MEIKMQTVTITNRETGESFQAKVQNQAEYEGLSEWDKFKIVEVEMMEQLRDIGYNCSVKKVGSPAIFEWLCTVLFTAVFELGNQPKERSAGVAFDSLLATKCVQWKYIRDPHPDRALRVLGICYRCWIQGFQDLCIVPDPFLLLSGVAPIDRSYFVHHFPLFDPMGHRLILAVFIFSIWIL